MKHWRSDVKMTPGAWLLAFAFAVGIVLFAIITFWALWYLGMWFITFWYGRVL